MLKLETISAKRNRILRESVNDKNPDSKMSSKEQECLQEFERITLTAESKNDQAPAIVSKRDSRSNKQNLK